MSKITAMYIRLSMEDEDVSLNQKEESNSVSSQRELLEAFIGNHSGLRIRRDYIEVGSLLEQIFPLYQVRVIAVNDNYDSDNYDGSTGGMNVAFKNLIY